MNRLRLVLLVLIGTCAAAHGVHAQEVPLAVPVPNPGTTSYDSAIPTPDDVLGYRIGTRHTEPAQAVDYFETIAEQSDRVRLEEHGRTYEGRPLIHAIVTSPENMARLDAIRTANQRLWTSPDEVSEADLEAMPAVVYMGYSIHGNEASGTEASLLLLYHLAAGSGPAVEDVLDSTVVVIDPMFNPDGRGRFVDWVNRNRGAVATSDPQDREHNEPWPGGRTNHYWFDLNRDWLLQQHPESQGRIDVFYTWRPQVLTDFHEMGSNSTFFFQPGVPSRTNPNTPALNQELTAEIGTYHAEALDRMGQLYYSQESYDDFYYGKGSTYPDINGAIGILFEQASSRALERESDFGTFSYATTVRNQFATSLSTLKAVSEMREKLLRQMRDFYATASDFADASDVKGYVVGLERGRTRAQALAQLLRRHRVRIHTLARDVEVDGRTFRSGEAYVLPMDQPQARLLKAVMEKTTTFTDSLFYDVSAWTLPLAFDVDYAELRRNMSGLLGAEVDDVTLDGGALVGGRSEYAYLMDWDRYYAPRALYRLQAAGIRPMVMTDPFTATVGGRPHDFARGTIVIPVAQADVDAETVQRLVGQLPEQDFVRVYAVETGLTPSGPDIGSRSVSVLERPRVALVTGEGTSSYNAGEVWHLLDQRYHMPVSLLDLDEVGDADLDRYNTLVLAGGYYPGLDAISIQDWVRRGGTLIALDDAVDWVKNAELVDLEERTVNLDSLMRDRPYAELSEAYGAQVIGGAIFNTQLDVTHPLAYGMPEELPVFRSRSAFYEPLDEPGTNVARYTEHPLLSGYISEERLEHLGGSAAVVAKRVGRGHVVLFVDDPNFRAFWYGTNPLFMNAVFLGQMF